MVERHFDVELNELNKDIIRLGAMAQESIVSAAEAIKKQDKAAAQAIIDNDENVDLLELNIDEKCIDLIALHQPMASDLRFVTTGMKINAELERIADLSVDVAQRAIELSSEPLLKPLVDIPKLAVIAQQMVGMAIDSFVERNVEKAKQVILRDAEADKLRNLVQDELINNYLSKDPTTAHRAVPLLLVARHLERICDHATNIAEDVVYMVKGKVVKHHHEEL